MNYEDLYLKMCIFFKKTNFRERLQKRDKNDFRLLNEKIYIEKHHILPKSLGGTDDSCNLIEVLPEEHLILHKIRYKAYNKRQDFLAVRMIINGFNGKKQLSLIDMIDNRKMKNIYAWFRENCYKFRTDRGWQTDDGKKRISLARKNKIPGKCSKTGVILGEFDINDPRVLSGEIVHHSKGKHSYYNPNTGEKIYCNVGEQPKEFLPSQADFFGTKNPSYSNITDGEIIIFCDKLIRALKKNNINEFPSIKFVKKIWDITDDRTFPNMSGGLKSGFRFKGNLYEGLIKPLCEKHKINYNKYSKKFSKIDKRSLLNDIN